MLIVVASISIIAIYFPRTPHPTPKRWADSNRSGSDFGKVRSWNSLWKDLIVFKLMEISSDMITLAPKKNRAHSLCRKTTFMTTTMITFWPWNCKNIESSKVLLSVRKLKELRLKDRDNYSIGLAGDLKTQAQDETSNPASETALVAVARILKTFYPDLGGGCVKKARRNDRLQLVKPWTKNIGNQALKIQSIGSDLSAIELQVGERTFKFEKPGCWLHSVWDERRKRTEKTLLAGGLLKKIRSFCRSRFRSKILN